MRFNLDDYETVESRIRKFYELHPDGRITTQWQSDYISSEPIPNPFTWVIKASVYISADDQENNRPKATGYAFERDGTGGANQTSALENAETSAIGRALANMNLSGNKRASREEIEKVIRTERRDWVAESDNLTDVRELRLLWAAAKAAGAPKAVLDKVAARAKAVDTTGVDK